MKHPIRTLVAGILIACAATAPHLASAHGNVTPQGVDTTGLAPLGEKWRAENPY